MFSYFILMPSTVFHGEIYIRCFHRKQFVSDENDFNVPNEMQQFSIGS